MRAKRPGSPVWCRQLHPHRGRRLFSQRTGQAGAGPSAAPVLCPVEPSLILQCRADRPRLNRPPLSVRSVFHGFPILLVGLCAPFRQGVCVHLRSAGSRIFPSPLPSLSLSVTPPTRPAPRSGLSLSLIRLPWARRLTMPFASGPGSCCTRGPPPHAAPAATLPWINQT